MTGLTGGFHLTRIVTGFTKEGSEVNLASQSFVNGVVKWRIGMGQESVGGSEANPARTPRDGQIWLVHSVITKNV